MCHRKGQFTPEETRAQGAGRVLVRLVRAGCLVPNGLCRIYAADVDQPLPTARYTRRRLYGG